MNSNLPVWGPDRKETFGAFQEAWHLKINDPTSQRALWIRMGILVSGNGFRRIAETSAVLYQRTAKHDVSHFAVRQTHEIRSFSHQITEQGPLIRIGDCELGPDFSRGTISSKGQTLSWNLTFTPREESNQYDLMTPSMKKIFRTGHTQITAHSDLLFSGTTHSNAQELLWKDSPGMQNHQSGPRNALSWTWGHCNSFVNEKGEPVPFVFEGLTSRLALFGPLRTPTLSSFHFRYAGKSHFFNTLGDILHLSSTPSLNEWRFQADHDQLSFRGVAHTAHKDFTGLTFEDTDGGLIYDTTSRLSDLKIHVYRRGKVEATLLAQGTLAMDVASRKKNPYVPLAL